MELVYIFLLAVLPMILGKNGNKCWYWDENDSTNQISTISEPIITSTNPTFPSPNPSTSSLLTSTSNPSPSSPSTTSNIISSLSPTTRPMPNPTTPNNNCSLWDLIDSQTDFASICHPTISPTTSSSSGSLPPNFGQCYQKCRATDHYNPVCAQIGVQRVTYTNEFKLRCARQCGLDVEILYEGNCGGVPPSPLPITEDPSTAMKDCLRRCPSTAQYSPVCGNQGGRAVTYDNISKLRCSQKCGKGVTFLYENACSSSVASTTETFS